MLSPRGEQQSVESGDFIRQEKERIEKLEGRKFDRIIIDSSPFIRCLQTASRIALPLGVEEVEINCLHFESLINTFL